MSKSNRGCPYCNRKLREKEIPAGSSQLEVQWLEALRYQIKYHRQEIVLDAAALDPDNEALKEIMRQATERLNLQVRCRGEKSFDKLEKLFKLIGGFCARLEIRDLELEEGEARSFELDKKIGGLVLVDCQHARFRLDGENWADGKHRLMDEVRVLGEKAANCLIGWGAKLCNYTRTKRLTERYTLKKDPRGVGLAAYKKLQDVSWAIKAEVADLEVIVLGACNYPGADFDFKFERINWPELQAFRLRSPEGARIIAEDTTKALAERASFFRRGGPDDVWEIVKLYQPRDNIYELSRQKLDSLFDVVQQRRPGHVHHARLRSDAKREELAQKPGGCGFLRELELEGFLLQDDVFDTFLMGLPQSAKETRAVLRLVRCGLSNPKAQIMAERLRKLLPWLEELGLRDCDFVNDNFLEVLFETKVCCDTQKTSLKHLKRLDLFGTPITANRWWPNNGLLNYVQSLQVPNFSNLPKPDTANAILPQLQELRVEQTCSPDLVLTQVPKIVKKLKLRLGSRPDSNWCLEFWEKLQLLEECCLCDDACPDGMTLELAKDLCTTLKGEFRNYPVVLDVRGTVLNLEELCLFFKTASSHDKQTVLTFAV